MVKVNFFDQDWVDNLESVLRSIIHDATGDLKEPTKRVWSIRAANYRKASKLLDESPNKPMEQTTTDTPKRASD